MNETFPNINTSIIDSGTLQMDTLLAIHVDGQVKELAPGKFPLFIEFCNY